jgi:hypothetical protein
MRRFKTSEELEQERLEALGLLPFKMPTGGLLLIYARQSTKGQTIKNRESAMQQTQDQLERATELGWPSDKRLLFIENQAKDGTVHNASGRLRIDEREGLSTVMIYIESGEASAVMARDVARFFRDEDLVGPVVFAKACKDHNVIVITDDYIYKFNDKKRGREDYKKFIQEAQAAADFLEKHVKGVMHKNKNRKALRGEFAGHGIPTGFMLDENRAHYLPNPYHAKPMKDLFKRFRALGGNVPALRREIVGKPYFPDLPPHILERTGPIYLTKVKGGWTIKSQPGLIGMLTNPAYIGHVAYNGRIVKKNAHPAIVDEDDFWYAYYRLAHFDFEGNPIEHPKGVTKRYQQANRKTIQALLSGLRNDGTPVVTTTISEKSGVYVGDGMYRITDRSKIEVSCTRVSINVNRLDTIFSERLLYRMREVLENESSFFLNEESETLQLENRRREIHSELVKRLDETEQLEGEKPTLITQLKASIAETNAKIADKERKLDVAGNVMSDKDLQDTYAALKRLRLNLATMEKKLDQIAQEEGERQQAKKELPEIYAKWSSMNIEAKQRLIRVATSQITLDSILPGWLKLTIEWSPLLGGNLIDEAYIWNPNGSDTAWSEEEKHILQEYYLTASRQQLLELLPRRSWIAINSKGRLSGIKRPWSKADLERSVKSELISLVEWNFIQEYDLPAEELLDKRVYWREYIGSPVLGNSETPQRRRSCQARARVPPPGRRWSTSPG